MDNLSHSVVGLAVGELVHRTLPQEPDRGRQQIRRRLLLLSCWAASNFPDLDFFLTPLLPAPLGYLLHHRGHTHTVLYAIPQAMLLSAILWLLWPSARTLLQKSGSARIGMVLTLTLGFTVHLLMDYLNWYGVHPFYPFDARWLYGDMVFIVEPLFWIAFGVPMAMMAPLPAFRVMLVALLLGAPLFFTTRGYLPWGAFAALAGIAAALGALQYRVRNRGGVRGASGLLAALAVGIGFVGVQGYASGQAKRAVAEAVHKMDAASRVLDAAVSSFPTNPLCWNFVSVERNDAAGSYRLRRGIVSVAPDILPVAACPAPLAERPSQTVLTPAIALLSQQQGRLDTLRTLKNENCYFAAWLRFARAPWLHDAEATDIRFGLDVGRNFTTMHLADFKDSRCPRLVPGWDFPRADLLTPPVPPPAR